MTALPFRTRRRRPPKGPDWKHAVLWIAVWTLVLGIFLFSEMFQLREKLVVFFIWLVLCSFTGFFLIKSFLAKRAARRASNTAAKTEPRSVPAKPKKFQGLLSRDKKSGKTG